MPVQQVPGLLLHIFNDFHQLQSWWLSLPLTLALPPFSSLSWRSYHRWGKLTKSCNCGELKTSHSLCTPHELQTKTKLNFRFKTFSFIKLQIVQQLWGKPHSIWYLRKQANTIFLQMFFLNEKKKIGTTNLRQKNKKSTSDVDVAFLLQSNQIMRILLDHCSYITHKIELACFVVL